MKPAARESNVPSITFNIKESLELGQREAMVQLLEQNKHSFTAHESDLGWTSRCEHRIGTGDAELVKVPPYRKSRHEREVVRKEVDKLLQAKVIRKSDSPWSSPIMLVKKKDGGLRFCVDLKRLNTLTRKDAHPPPRIDDAMETLSGAKFFSSMNLASGYWQVPIREEDKEKTAFSTEERHYEFNVLGLGLCNAPGSFQRRMNNVLGSLL